MFFESFLQDVRVGLRVLTKEKTFCILAVTVLALGICGVTTQFTVVNAFVLRGFSFPHPEELMSVGFIDPQATENQNNNGAGNIPSSQDYEDLKAAQQSFAMMTGYLNGSTINVTYKNNPTRYTGGYVTEDFFRILGVSPFLGRDFTAEDNKPGSEKVTLIGHEIWQRDFGADPNIVGQSIRINGKAATVIGVMPPNFKFPIAEQLWVPLYNEFPIKQRDDPTGLGPQVIGRLRPGVSVDQANLEFIELARRLSKEYPKSNGQLTSASVQPLLKSFVGPQLRQTVYAMLGAVIVVLLIACVNVMNMQFGRAALRAKELAIRGALGATRWRIVRQMLTESLLVASLGAVVGVLMAFWAVGLLVRATNALPFPLPYWVSFNIDAPVLIFTVAITLIATMVSGLVPALLSARANPAEVMKEGGRGNSSRLVNALTRVLVVGQIALTAALLIAATLQIKSVRNQTTVNYGYDENAVYTARMGLFDGDYPTPEARQQFFVRALQSLRTNPVFENATMTDRFRMTFANFGQYEVDGQTYVTDRDRPRGNSEAVADSYFTTLGIKLLEGRDFTIDDNDARQPVAIVNTSFARKYFGHESPLGRRIRNFNPAKPQPWRTVVGVVPDTLMQGPFNQETDSAGFYIPLLGVPPAPQFVTVVVRPHRGQSAETLAPLLGKAVSQIDANLPVYFGGTPARLHDEILGVNRITATLFTIFGAAAVVLSAVGLYGVMSFSVNQRTQEFGIRMALGADAGRILGMVMRQGAWQLVIGLVIGVGTAALLVEMIGAQALQNFLFRVNPRDVLWIYCATAGLLSAVAAASVFLPARRATRVNPIVALRTE
ncbi:MAG: ABC transporter permease [Chthoniobacterales bacterium]|nr:ABC transporter permease [Chthoniobacterales bacterium]MBA3762361.1 ABC transporter permease [Chthoniobacterales bacterium]